MNDCTQWHWRNALAMCATATLIWAALSGPTAWALIKAEAVTLEYQVRNSDIIVRGTCEDCATTWANNHLVTTYKIAVKKYIKTAGKMSVETNPVIYVSQVGGRVSAPLPIAEQYPEMAVLFPGEEVVLFLQSPDRVPAGMKAKYQTYLDQGLLKPTPLMTNYRLTTLNISKLTVIKDPKTGVEVVTRLNFDRLGILPSQEAVKKYVEAIQSQQTSVDTMVGDRTVRIPVQLGRPVIEGPGSKSSAEAADVPVEEKIRRMQSYTSTIESFEHQVEAILQGSSNSGTVKRNPQTEIRSMESRKER